MQEPKNTKLSIGATFYLQAELKLEMRQALFQVYPSVTGLTLCSKESEFSPPLGEAGQAGGKECLGLRIVCKLS